MYRPLVCVCVCVWVCMGVCGCVERGGVSSEGINLHCKYTIQYLELGLVLSSQSSYK